MEGLLFSVWLQPAQHKSTTSDWAAKVVPITGTWVDVKEPSTSITEERTGPKNGSAPSSRNVDQGSLSSHTGLGGT